MKKESKINTKENKLVKVLLLGTITLLVGASGFVYATNITKDNKNEKTEVAKYYTEVELEDDKKYDFIEEDCSYRGEDCNETITEKEDVDETSVETEELDCTSEYCEYEEDCECGPEFEDFEIEDVSGVSKDDIEYFLNTAFGVRYQKGEYVGSVQPKTVLSLLDKAIEELDENQKKNNEYVQSGLIRFYGYTNLLYPETYGLGDKAEMTIIESNYKQYDFTRNLEENEREIKLEKYNKPIHVKLGMINEAIANDFSEKKSEYGIDELLDYQAKELNNNFNNYYYGIDEESPEDLKFVSTGMIIMNGNNTSKEEYLNNARAKKIKVTINDVEYIFELKDTLDVQLLDLDYETKDISKALDITVEVLETYEGKLSQDVYIADVQFNINSNIPMSR